MCTSIVLIGCLQPSRLAPERAPVVERTSDIGLKTAERALVGVYRSVEDWGERRLLRYLFQVAYTREAWAASSGTHRTVSRPTRHPDTGSGCTS